MEARKLLEACGPYSPNMTTSTGNSMLVHFYSDISEVRSGFQAVYFTLPDPNATSPVGEFRCYNYSNMLNILKYTFCGGVF